MNEAAIKKAIISGLFGGVSGLIAAIRVDYSAFKKWAIDNPDIWLKNNRLNWEVISMHWDYKTALPRYWHGFAYGFFTGSGLASALQFNNPV